MRHVYEKYLAKWNHVFSELIDLEKAYDIIDLLGMWQMLRVHEVGGKLLTAVESFYVDRSTIVRVGLSRSGCEWWFSVNVRLRKGCVIEKKVALSTLWLCYVPVFV